MGWYLEGRVEKSLKWDLKASLVMFLLKSPLVFKYR